MAVCRGSGGFGETGRRDHKQTLNNRDYNLLKKTSHFSLSAALLDCIARRWNVLREKYRGVNRGRKEENKRDKATKK